MHSRVHDRFVLHSRPVFYLSLCAFKGSGYFSLYYYRIDRKFELKKAIALFLKINRTALKTKKSIYAIELIESNPANAIKKYIHDVLRIRFTHTMYVIISVERVNK